eukprot:CAMPEP_0182562044 /NCGR_PEP_ID=MMETSP1324-20130603/4441_1 /TAXON_ID=236786 /ORGANISM="Florenciella sp., Strain RCC1587" /LENGTH=308 /DNA_ID=CAMNT_0024774865 /DNA_START=15 /DNA_END=941 /DNA_ORIENTATION=-
MTRQQMDLKQTPQEALSEAQLYAGAAMFRAAAALDRASSEVIAPEEAEDDTLSRPYLSAEYQAQQPKTGPIATCVQLLKGMHAFSRGWMARTAVRIMFWRRLDRLLEAASFGAMRTDVDIVPYKDYKEMVRGDDTRTRLNLAIEQLRGELADKRATSGDLGLNLDSLSDDDDDGGLDGVGGGSAGGGGGGAGLNFGSTPRFSTMAGSGSAGGASSNSLTPNLDAMGLGRTALPKGGIGGDDDVGSGVVESFKSPLDRAPSPSPSPSKSARGSITDSVREMLDRVVDRTDSGEIDKGKVDDSESEKKSS